MVNMNVCKRKLPGSGQRCLQTHCGAELARANLNQVAELIDEPKAAAALLGGRRVQPAGEGLVDPAPVLELDQQALALPPGAQGARTAAVGNAVGGELAGGHDQVVGPP